MEVTPLSFVEQVFPHAWTAAAAVLVRMQRQSLRQ
jgi:hypothetical protein